MNDLVRYLFCNPGVSLTRPIRSLLAGATLLMLAACGGGDSSSPPPPVAVAPTISSQPQSSTVNAGQAATFGVTASGSAPLSYQWKRDGTAIPGATSASYISPATIASDNGASYTVVVSNAAGSVTSTAATLTVTTAPPLAVAPTISVQPQSTTVTAGQTATFGVTASGTAPLSYQWRRNGSPITGATNASYTTPAVALSDNSAQFTVVVSNAAGSVTSQQATLAVISIPLVQTSIAAVSPVLPGQQILFTATEANAGTSPTGLHNLYATVPAYTTVEQAAAQSAFCTGTWPCQPGQQVYWQLSTGANQSNSRQFSAKVASGAGGPPNGTQLTSTVTTNLSGVTNSSSSVIVSTSAGLQLSLRARPAVVAAGATLTYLLNYSNTSATDITSILTMPLPAGVSFVSASDGGALTSGSVQWSPDTIVAGSSGQRQLVVTVENPAAILLLSATAQLRDTNLLAVLASATEILDVTGDPALTSITATPGAPAQPGQPILFTVTETNAGASSTGLHNLYVTVPAYTTVEQAAAQSAFCTGTWPCQPGQQVYWQLSTGANQSNSRQFSATAVSGPGAPPNGTQLTSTVTTNLSGATNSAVSVVMSGAAGLNLSLHGTPAVVASGSTITYLLTYSNTSPAGINAGLTMPLPTGVSFVSASDGGAATGGSVQWNLGTVAPGSSGQRQLVVTVENPATILLVNAAARLRDSALSAVMATATDASQVIGDSVATTIAATPGGPVQAGQPILFTLIETNSGASSTGLHNLYATVPAYTTVPQAAAQNGFCTGVWPCQPGEQVYWQLSTGAGQSNSRQFSATVVSGPGVLANGTQLTSIATATLSGAGQSATTIVVTP
jgi:uncharacterized repeat protein (TIGR01451 family)